MTEIRLPVIRLPVIPDMDGRLARLVDQIPPGRVSTCGRLAKALGDVAAARWVGHFLLHHDHAANCPCHRVVRADGQLGNYVTNDVQDKARLLRGEGISISSGKIDIAQFVFDDFASDRPLVSLRAWQQQVAHSVSTQPPHPSQPPDARQARLAAVDVSYAVPNQATAAYVLFDLATFEKLWSFTITRAVAFPYISSYLAFRELPLYVELLDKVRSLDRLADVLLVDGSGILHPRRAGIACCLGVVADVPTVGITKKRLCGEVERTDLPPGGSCHVVIDGQIVGSAIRSSPRSKKPIYVSPGHRTDVALSLDLVRTTLGTRRLPEPIYWADRLSREASMD